MTLNTAYRILRLSSNATHAQLVTAYRRLVKRYHPDYNANRREWSHDAMTRINQAYELVTIHMGAPRRHGAASGTTTASSAPEDPRSDTEPGSDGSRPAGRQPFSEDYADSFAAEPAEDPAFVALFHEAADAVLDGIYTYYQYGLQNVYLRHEGVRRFRYRTALKRVRDGLGQLKQIEQLQVSETRRARFAAFKEFAVAFLHSMLIDKYHHPGDGKNETGAYRHYRNGSESLDSVICDELFDELSTLHRRTSVAGNLKISYHELMTVLVKHSTSDWIPQAIIRLQLLDAFTKVTTMRNGR